MNKTKIQNYNNSCGCGIAYNILAGNQEILGDLIK